MVMIGADNSGLKKGLDDSKRKVGGFGKNIGKLTGIIAAAFSVRAVLNFGQELVKLGGKAEGVEKAFKRVGSVQLLEDLKQATSNTVSELELMRSAVQASHFDIPLENLASLFEFAKRRAQETGESVDYLTNSIVVGIGRKSPLILDNLGISTARLREELKGVGTQTAEIGDVAAAVGRIAREEMSKSGDKVVTSSDKVASFTAEWENLKTMLGKQVAPTIASVFATISEGMRRLTFSFDEYKENIVDKGVKEIRDSISELDEETRRSKMIDYINSLSSETAELRKRAEEIKSKKLFVYSKEYKQARDELRYIREEIAANMQISGIVKENFESWATEIKESGEEAEKVIGKIEAIQAKIEKIEETIPGLATEMEIAQANDQLRELNKELERLQNLTARKTPALTPAIPKTTAGVSVDDGGEDDMLAGLRGRLSAYQKEAVDNFNETKDNILDIGAALQQGMADVLISIAEGIGQAFSTGDFSSVLDNFIKTFANFAKQFGSLLVSWGIAQTALASGGLNPTQAIAAGAALVAIGTALGAVSSAASNFAASGRGGYASSSSMMSEPQSMNINIEGILKGKDIYLVNQRYGTTLENTR